MTTPDHGDRVTRPGSGDVETHLAGIVPARRREDAQSVVALMREVTGAEPVMWGSSMVGFGRQPYTTADGRQGEWFAVGLAARTAALVLYGLTLDGSHAELLEQLGPHTTGKGCLYLKALDAVDPSALRALIALSWSENHADAADSADS